MSSTPTTNATSAPTTTNSTTASKKDLPQLLPLEEDDEFEEFPSEDWDEKDTFGAQLNKGDKNAAGGAGQASSSTKALDSLWEDSWDDDDVDDDFSVQLRGELQKQDSMQS